MSPEDVATQVERIVASPLFSQSVRLTRFLRFIVRAVADGQGNSLKEYSIGVEVFDRGLDFDPRIDNVVRIHAAKLRSKLTEYYVSNGSSDSIVISVPRGTYVPEIDVRSLRPTARDKPGTGDRSRIAVLPFVNMSSDPEAEYFTDGLTEELIGCLAGNPALQVVARTSAFQFKGQNEDLREVGAKLNVGVVLEGSVRRAGDQVRVTAQLIDVATGYHLFSRTYQREYKAIFELQDELARAVAREIAPEHPLESRSSSTTNPDAYNAYLRGMHALASQFTDLAGSVHRFQEAMELDPEYAPAWAGMAQGHFMLAWFYRAGSDEVLPACRQAALKALSLDPDSALGLQSLGLVECALDWNWPSAEARFRRAIDLQPSITSSYINYAFFCLLPQLRLTEACDILERGFSLDPFNPWLQAIMLYAYGRAGRYHDALRQNALARSIGPGYAPIPVCMGGVYEAQGDLDAAIASYREACDLSANAPYPFSCLGHSLAMAGHTAEARDILEQMERAEPPHATDIARVYCGLRDTEGTLRWLEIAAQSRSIHLLRATGDPRFFWLSGHERYQAVIHGMGLPLPGLQGSEAGPRVARREAPSSVSDGGS